MQVCPLSLSHTHTHTNSCNKNRACHCLLLGAGNPQESFRSSHFPQMSHYFHRPHLRTNNLQKEPLIAGLFGGKRPVKIRHPMHFRHPVLSSASFAQTTYKKRLKIYRVLHKSHHQRPARHFPQNEPLFS